MDIRGVEITNQLRSAIRAKLLELGVKYDEELPDYILVMVVNKKSRQQMTEDLNLFLEDSTEPFVNWLHDQVLKKLQKVTVAKKKVNKDIVANVKQEDEEKKLKVEKSENSPKSHGLPEVVTKKERDMEFEELIEDLEILNEDDSKDSFNQSKKSADKSQGNKINIHTSDFEDSNDSQPQDSFTPTKTIPASLISERSIISPIRTTQKDDASEKNIVTPERASHFDISSEKNKDHSSSSLKRTSNAVDNISDEFDVLSAKQSKLASEANSDSSQRIKSSVSKPKITSVVSVKSRLDVSSNKQRDQSSRSASVVRNKSDTSSHRHSNFSRGRSSERRKSEDARTDRSRSDRNEKSRRFEASRGREDKSREIPSTIKSRLGTFHKPEKSLKPSSTTRVSKPRISNVKSRLGFKTMNREVPDLLTKLKHSNKSFDEEDDDAVSKVNMSLKSQVIAIQKPKRSRTKEQEVSSQSKKVRSNKESKKVEDDPKSGEEDDDSKVPSKVIVTPRPLKPLQPFQKRATQSLLLKAVAEANKSVVLKKHVDPCLKEQKPEKKIKITKELKGGRVISVNLNPKKKQITEKIQIELHNRDRRKSKKSSLSKLSNEHLEVVKSLFQRSDDKQKFLVTLNGYNNNDHENRNSDEEQFEIESNEDEEYIDYDQYEYSENHETIGDHDQNDVYEIVDEQANCSNLEEEAVKKRFEMNKSNGAENLKQSISSSKRKQLSPIVYNVTRSDSPNDVPSLESAILNINKKPLISSVITMLPDKSNEKCRYWPKCDLGIKCAYFHPDVPCSSFPACKFGDKCAYKHPKCKFGSSCTKLNCIFSHPPMQCKYHPYCMKPGCQFSHPKTTSSSPLSPLAPLPPDISTLKAKFTWKKKEST